MKKLSILLIIAFILNIVYLPIINGDIPVNEVSSNQAAHNIALKEAESITIIPTVHGIDWKQAKLDNLTITIIYGTDAYEKRRTYSFEYDGNTIKAEDLRPFKVPLQYDQNGKPIYEYSYFITAEFDSGIPKFNSGMLKSSAPILNIGPLDLNLFCVSIQASSIIDWEQINSISIEIECQGVKAPLVELDKNNTKKAIVYPMRNKPNDNQTYNYKYTAAYNMEDGTYKTTGNTNQVELVIPSFVNEKAVYTFIADEDPAIKNIFLTLEYEDSNNKYRKRINVIDIYNCKDRQYQWEIPVIDSRSGDVFYSGSIIYNDGSPIKPIPRTKASSSNVLVYKGTPKFELDIMPFLIDWNKFMMAIITLEYKDEVNHIYYRTSRKFVRSSEEQKWVINVADRNKTEYTWSGQFITIDRRLYKLEPSRCDSNYLLIIPPQI